MRTVKSKIWVTVWLAFFAVCAFGQANLQSGIWRLVTLRDAGGIKHRITDGENYTIEFKEEGKAAVQADCNACGAAYTVTHYGITITVGACTRMYCGADSHDFDYIRGLSHAEYWGIIQDTLVLTNGKGVDLLSLYRPAPPEEGLYDIWTLESVRLASGQNPPVEERKTLHPGKDGSLSIMMDCNICLGSYAATNTTITIGTLMTCTEMACRVDPVYPFVVEAFKSQANYLLQENKLFILFHENADTLIYTNGGTTGVDRSRNGIDGYFADLVIDANDGSLTIALPEEAAGVSISLHHVNGELLAYRPEVKAKTVTFDQSLASGLYLVILAAQGYREGRIVIMR